MIHPDFEPNHQDNVIAGDEAVRNNDSSKMDIYWQPLFSDDISVTDFTVEIYPHTDPNLGWKHFPDTTPNADEKNQAINIAPYIRLSLSLQPSRKKRVS